MRLSDFSSPWNQRAGRRLGAAALVLLPLGFGSAQAQTVNLGPNDNIGGGAVNQLNFLFSDQGTSNALYRFSNGTTLGTFGVLFDIPPGASLQPQFKSGALVNSPGGGLFDATNSRLVVSPPIGTRFDVLADQVYLLGLYGFRINVGTRGNDNQIKVEYRFCYNADGTLVNDPLCRGTDIGGGGGIDPGPEPIDPGPIDPGDPVLPPGLPPEVEDNPGTGPLIVVPLNNVISALVPRNTDGPSAGMQKLLSVLGSTVLEQEPQQVRQGSRFARPVPKLTATSGSASGATSGASPGAEGVSRPYASPVDMPVEGKLVPTQPQLPGVQGFTFTRETSQYFSDRDGLRSWARGFGFGLSNIDKPQSSGYYISRADARGGGGVLGVEASVSPNTQVGVYGSVSGLSVIQSGFGGGGWNPTGWGGGLYGRWSTESFFLGGLLGYTGFSGTQTRNILLPGTALTASGEKTANAFTAALTGGGRINLGPDTLLTPSLIYSWSSINENGFNESGASLRVGGQTFNGANLRYGSSNSSWSNLDLGVTLSQTIRSKTTLILPSLRLGWFGNWRNSGGGQPIGYTFTNNTFNVPGGWLDRNGLRAALGLDVVTAGNATIYLKGTVDLGFDSRGSGAIADYGVNGGLSLRF